MEKCSVVFMYCKQNMLKVRASQIESPPNSEIFSRYGSYNIFYEPCKSKDSVHAAKKLKLNQHCLESLVIKVECSLEATYLFFVKLFPDMEKSAHVIIQIEVVNVFNNPFCNV
jgi:hypothetical protein